MKINELIGLHRLQGIEQLFNYEIYDYPGEIYKTTNAILVRIDNVNYLFIEDPSDGYRSYLKDVEITDTMPRYKLPSIFVHIIEADRNMYNDNDFIGIDIIDVITNGSILIIGTSHSTDYYPTCILEYHPENLCINNRDMTECENEIYNEILNMSSIKTGFNLFENNEDNELIVT